MDTLLIAVGIVVAIFLVSVIIAAVVDAVKKSSTEKQLTVTENANVKIEKLKEDRRPDKADELANMLRELGIENELMRILKKTIADAKGKEDAQIVIGLRYKGYKGEENEYDEENENEDNAPRTDLVKTAGLLAIGYMLGNSKKKQ